MSILVDVVEGKKCSGLLQSPEHGHTGSWAHHRLTDEAKSWASAGLTGESMWT